VSALPGRRCRQSDLCAVRLGVSRFAPDLAGLEEGELVQVNQLLPPSSFRPGGTAPGSAVGVALVAALIVAALYFGREVLMPVALAVLMSFVLAPLVRLLQRWWVPRLAAVFIVVVLALAALFLLGTLMVTQVNQLASDLPRYQFTLREKIQSLRQATAGSSTLGRASEVLQDLGKELDRKESAPGAVVERGAAASAGKPIPVEVRQPDPPALETLAALIGPLVHPLATTGIVVIFVIFILCSSRIYVTGLFVSPGHETCSAPPRP
jgi:predicted PurR-regulated permease PerM